jgi:hypothetical protein
MPVVTRVRKVQAPEGRHEHIAGVCTVDGSYFSRQEVASSLDAGEDWWSEGGGTRTRIRKAPYCPVQGCLTFPYLTTAPDHTPTDNLEHLPTC